MTSAGFNPYREWLGIESPNPSPQELLGLDPWEGDVERIAQAAQDRLTVLMEHLGGANYHWAQKLTGEVIAAQQRLSEPPPKSAEIPATRAGAGGGPPPFEPGDDLLPPPVASGEGPVRTATAPARAIVAPRAPAPAWRDPEAELLPPGVAPANAVKPVSDGAVPVRVARPVRASGGPPVALLAVAGLLLVVLVGGSIAAWNLAAPPGEVAKAPATGTDAPSDGTGSKITDTNPFPGLTRRPQAGAPETGPGSTTPATSRGNGSSAGTESMTRPAEPEMVNGPAGETPEAEPKPMVSAPMEAVSMAPEGTSPAPMPAPAPMPEPMPPTTTPAPMPAPEPMVTTPAPAMPAPTTPEPMVATPAPMAPMPMKVEPADEPNVVKALGDVRVALRKRDMAAAQERLDVAQLEAQSPASIAAVERMSAAVASATTFWGAVDRSVSGLKGTEEIELGDDVILVVEAGGGRVVFRINGRNQAFTAATLPGRIAVALAERGLTKNAPETKVAVAAFHLFDARGDEALGKKLLEELAGVEAVASTVTALGELTP